MKGSRCLLPFLLTMVMAGFILSAGCTAPVSAKGPLLRYLESRTTVQADMQDPGPGAAHTPPALITPDPTDPVPTTPPTEGEGYAPLRPAPVAGDPIEYRTFTFRYRGEEYVSRIPVNMSLLAAASQSPNKGLLLDSRNGTLFYSRMLEDPAMGAFLNDTVREIRKLRYKGGSILTDDEYLEMLVAFVQQIPYENTTRFPRSPIEVISFQGGDCDEKSVLLTGMLAREGYDSALLIFPELNHATAGIRIHLVTANPSFRVFTDGKRDYVYIETTTDRLIGIYPEEYAAASDPVIIPGGHGTLLYDKFTYVTAILYDLNTMRAKIRQLEAKAAAAGGRLGADDYLQYRSYVNTYNFVMSTSDRRAAQEAIQESELPHYSACLSCN